MQELNFIQRERKENRALITGGVANLVMAVFAWLTYYFSHSEAILLDGNYSFIMFIGILAALKIATIRARKTKTFPLGQFFYESLYSFIKGLMILGILFMSVVTAITRIVMYFSGASDKVPVLVPDPILYYAIVCALICYGVSLFYRQQNRLIGGTSILLKTEQKATFIDGTLSLGIALGIFFLTTGDTASQYSFIPHLADSFFVLVLAFMLFKEPLTIIKESVIELAGGSLQDKEKREAFEKVIFSNVPDVFRIKDIYISKNGSRYNVLIYIATDADSYSKKELNQTKDKIMSILEKDQPYLSLEIIL